jgi:AhpD family alkylhydroperoxidase
MAREFNKRIYTIGTFRRGIAEAISKMGEIRDAHRSGRVSRAFAERIMLAVTSVNKCRYCSYGHTRAALAAGVPEEDIRNLAAGELDKLPDDEIVALAYAQHYAESGGNPDITAWQRFVEVYGDDRARDISAYIRMISIGNLYGNTFDAFLSRMQFNPAPGSSLGQELGVLFGAFVFIPYELVKSIFSRRVYQQRLES